MLYKNKEKRNEASRKYYQDHKEQIKKTHKIWVANHKKERSATTHSYYLRNKKYFKQREINWRKNNPEKRKASCENWAKTHREKIKIDARRLRKERRWNIIDLLGGKCSNPDCPIPPEKMDKRALQIDHIDGGGTQERKNLNTFQLEGTILKRIKTGVEIKDYQLLCAYCNWIKRYENKEISGDKLEKV